jgi:dipeptidyl aminopeptidase/acylaminoacyl peptidase
VKSADTDATSTKVSAAVILSGVFDLRFPVRVIQRYLGGDYASRKDSFADASPVQHVHAGAPPFFVGHGTHDKVVPYRSAQIFVEDLQKEHVTVVPFVAQDGPHMYWTKNKYYAENLAAVESFLATTVGSGRE